MGSERLARNLFQAVVRASRGRKFLRVSRKLNNTELRYRARNMNITAHIMVVRAHFKSAEVGVRETGP